MRKEVANLDHTHVFDTRKLPFGDILNYRVICIQKSLVLSCIIAKAVKDLLTEAIQIWFQDLRVRR